MKHFTTARKFVVGGLAAVTVAGAALAFANSMTVTSQTLGSGSDPVDNTCETTVSYTTTWDGASKEFEVTGVKVDGTLACANKNVQVALVGGTTSLWDSGAAVALDASGDKTFTVTDGVDAADVTNAYATVNG